eukprot:gene22334-28922_t
MSCCPPGSEGYLITNYVPKGHVIKENDTEFYSTIIPTNQPIKQGIVLIPDVFGWNGGRTRAIADYLAEAGFLTVVPKVLLNTVDGGTDGDAKFPGFVKNNPWSQIKPRVIESIKYLKSHGVEKIGTVGFCWGGWPVALALKDPETSEIIAGANPHPSIINVNIILGEDSTEFIQGIRGPLLLLPAGNDPDDYRENGGFYQALKKIQPNSKTINEFNAVVHGFLPRGDVNDPVVKEHVTKALEYLVLFFNEQLV